MDLMHWLSYIETCHSEAIDMGLERVHEVAKRAKLLEFSCPVVMVAGTNGKGSTVAILGKLLQTVGKKVGTYTSPHLLRFNERIQINGCCIEDEQLCHAFAEVEKWREKIPLTFFEFTTLAMLWVFQHITLKLDIVILEVGLGGRLDAVNIIDPDLVIITSLGLDHQDYLGESIEKIAIEKAGILRPQIPVVLSDKARIQTLFACLKKNKNILYIEQEHFDYCDAFCRQWRFKDKVINIPDNSLPENSVSLALGAYSVLQANGFGLSELNSCVSCLENIGMTGRFHSLRIANVDVIFDVAHNPDGSLWLKRRLQQLPVKGKIMAVWASLRDKDLKGIIAPFIGFVDTWLIGELVGIQRAAPCHQLHQALKSQEAEKVLSFSSITFAFEQALKLAPPDGCIVVFGSFYTISQIWEKFLLNTEYQDNGLFCNIPTADDFSVRRRAFK